MTRMENGKLIWSNTELGLVARFFAFEVYKKTHRCEKCGSVTRLEVHHKDQNRYNNDKDNLRVLCKRHHNEIHNRMVPLNLVEELDPASVIQMYTIEKRPMYVIRERFNCSDGTIYKILESAGVPKRKSKRSMKVLAAIAKL
jgi:hypothetical protein